MHLVGSEVQRRERSVTEGHVADSGDAVLREVDDSQPRQSAQLLVDREQEVHTQRQRRQALAKNLSTDTRSAARLSLCDDHITGAFDGNILVLRNVRMTSKKLHDMTLRADGGTKTFM